MSPHEMAMKTIKDIAERKRKREWEIDAYEAKKKAKNHIVNRNMKDVR